LPELLQTLLHQRRSILQRLQHQFEQYLTYLP
jgi:hypothetical protein